MAADGGPSGQDGVLTAERQGKDSPRAPAPVVAAVGGGAAVDGLQHELAGRGARVRGAVVDAAAGEHAVLAEGGGRGAGRQRGEDAVVGEGLRAGRGPVGVVEGRQGAVGGGNAGGRVEAVPAVAVLAEHLGAPEGVAVVHLVVAVADAFTSAGPQDALAVEPAAPVRGFELVAEAALDTAAVGAQSVRLLRFERFTGVVGPVGRVGRVLLVLLVPADEELAADPVHGVAECAVGQFQGVVRAQSGVVDGEGAGLAVHGEHRPGTGDVHGFVGPERGEGLVQGGPAQLLGEPGPQGAGQRAGEVECVESLLDAVQGDGRGPVEEAAQLVDGLVGGCQAPAPQGVEQLLDAGVHLGRDARIVRKPADGGAADRSAAIGAEPGVNGAFQPGAEHRVGGECLEVTLGLLAPELQADRGTGVVDGYAFGEAEVEEVGVQMRPLVAVLVQPDRGALRAQQRSEPAHQVEEFRGHGLAGHPTAADRAVRVSGGVPAQPVAEAALRGDPPGRGRVCGTARDEQPQPGSRVVLRVGKQVEEGGGLRVGGRVVAERAGCRVEQPVGYGLATGRGQHPAQHPGLLLAAEPGRTGGVPDPAGQIGGKLAGGRRPGAQQADELVVRVTRCEDTGQPGCRSAEFTGGQAAEAGEQQLIRPPPVGIDRQAVGALGGARLRVGPGGGPAVRLQHPMTDGVPEPRQVGGRQAPGQALRVVHEPAGLLPGTVPAAAGPFQRVAGVGFDARPLSACPVGVRLGDAVIGGERDGSSGVAGHTCDLARRL